LLPFIRPAGKRGRIGLPPEADQAEGLAEGVGFIDILENIEQFSAEWQT
jgi:hypothetical protein